MAGRRLFRQSGFTLIELLVVMAILATLLSIAGPRYVESVTRAKEAALHTNLRLMRLAIDQYRADKGRFPDSLQQLVDSRYLRAVPVDPISDSVSTWTLSPHPDGVTKGIYDVHSGAPGLSREGTDYAQW